MHLYFGNCLSTGLHEIFSFFVVLLRFTESSLLANLKSELEL